MLNGACMEAAIKHNLPVLFVVKVKVEVLRDSGCSGVIVERNW